MNAKELKIALTKISPNGPWNVIEKRDEDKVWWVWKGDESQKPTEEQIQQAWDSVGYQYERKYPEVGEQLDMIFHAIDSGNLDKTSDFYKAIKAVKDTHPEPNAESNLE